MAADDIWILISKKLSGEATPADLKALERLVAGNENNKHALLILEQLWQLCGSELNQKSTEDLDKSWQKFRHRLKSEALN